MSLSFGSLGLLSPWTPLHIWGQSVHARHGFRSLICVLVVLAVFLILAYLTNPTETSFRAYLTEQSFRQHLSHLDDLADDSGTELDPTHPRSHTHSASRNATVDRATLPFHFASRASISLRTPKHVFHSFGICTIATTRGAAVPAAGRRASTTHDRSDPDTFVSSDSWFVGALGRWWRGGLVESWYYDAMIRSKDAQGWSSGILGFKALDKFHDYDGLSFAKFAPYPRPSLRGPPPKLRNRERSAQRSGPIPHRNSSPPPLPKSASLPLHADHRLHDLLPATTQSSHLIADHKRIVHAPPVTHTISRTLSSSGIVDHSPIIAEVLRQITATQASVHDLQNQLDEAQNTARLSRESLEAELGDLRSRRREEEQKRVDGRARIKTLEETRRLAETSKREAEKKMKAARSVKDSAMRRVEELGLEIQILKERMERDRAILAEPSNADTAEEEELICELETKRKEVRVAEEVVVSLNTRARELEEKIDESKSRLRAAQRRIQLSRTLPNATDAPCFGVGNGNVVHQFNYGKADNSTWTSSYNPFDASVDDVLESPVGTERDQGDTEPEPRDASRSLKLAGLPSVLRAQGHAFFDDDTCRVDSGHSHNGYLQPGQVAPFSPFCDPPTPSAAFIPSSLISVLDSPSAECKGGFGSQNGSLTSSPVEYTGHSSEAEYELDMSDLGRAQSSHDQLRHSTTPYETYGLDGLQEVAKRGTEVISKELFSTRKSEKHRSGLNPDAKVFQLTRLTSDKIGNPDAFTSPYDALNPTGLMSSVTSSTPSSLLRAFAPSRAEREALQRALGGSTNTSLERLPSLSDVGSIPSSPVPAHAEAQGRNIGERGCVLPAWLQSLPLIRKPNFSPWEDEEQVSTEMRDM